MLVEPGVPGKVDVAGRCLNDEGTPQGFHLVADAAPAAMPTLSKSERECSELEALIPVQIAVIGETQRIEQQTVTEPRQYQWFS